MKKNLIPSSQNISTPIFLISLFVLVLIIFQGCGPILFSTASYQASNETYHPDWAPAYDYDDQARYYYIPDIEAYYDLNAREFICLEEGNWVFTSTLPYANYDIHNAFVVVLDNRVNQPWQHHELYVSHYPRYYYRTVYNSPQNTYSYHDMRGFNENGKRNIFRNNYSGNTANPSQRQYQKQHGNNRSTTTGKPESNQTNRQNTRTANQQQNNRTSTQQPDNNRTSSQQPRRTQTATEQPRQQNNTTGDRTTEPAGTNTRGNQQSNTSQQNTQETNKTQGDSRRTQAAEYKGKTIG
jgi:flagellar biosynthesis GTPase FlhF